MFVEPWSKQMVLLWACKGQSGPVPLNHYMGEKSGKEAGVMIVWPTQLLRCQLLSLNLQQWSNIET